ncbi:MAG TPA: hypothetical protein VGS07_22980 [Thermoanaerobaculia bacterium]|nr:hypothetical protein [Thermoanaerobaculia bacterium]
MGFIRRLKLRSLLGGAFGFSLLLAAIVYTAWKGTILQVVLKDSHPIGKSLPEDIWFTPEGALIMLEHQDMMIVVKKWQPGNFESPPSEISLSFAKQVGVAPRHSLRVDYVNPLVKWVPYAISIDAKKAAWWWRGSLHIQDIFASTTGGSARSDSINLGNLEPVESLSFSGASRISILYSSGTLETWNLDTRNKERAGTAFDGHWRTWTRGPIMALSCFDNKTGDVAIVQFPSAGKLNIQIVSDFLNGSALAVSPKGQIAVGTIDGLVVRYGSTTSVPLESSRAINSLAFYDERQVIVAGDFPGIYIVDVIAPSAPVRLTPSPGVRLIALTKDHLAYSSTGSTVIATLSQDRVSTPATGTLWKWVLGIISILGFILAVVRDQKSLV